jgi:hypothetical protein
MGMKITKCLVVKIITIIEGNGGNLDRPGKTLNGSFFVQGQGSKGCCTCYCLFSNTLTVRSNNMPLSSTIALSKNINVFFISQLLV